MKSIELNILKSAVEKYGSREKAAGRFKMNRSTLFRKMRGEKDK